VRVLDLFAGLGGWSGAFAERGHEVVTVDIEERFGTTIVADVMTLPDDMGDFQVICASPPCEKFSVMSMGAHWLPGYVPKHEGTLLAMELVRKTVRIIEATKPAFWVIENPMGMLRKLDLIPYEQASVTYCSYRMRYRKQTDLWGGFPPSLHLRERCKNGDPCHVPAPRGSRTGVQGDLSAFDYAGKVTHRDLAAERAKVPHDLALDVCIAAERDLAMGLRASDYSGRLFA
jgi:hypothetical protein